MHLAATFEAEVDLGGVRVAVIRADLARIPAGDREIAAGLHAQHILDVFLRVESRLLTEVEDVHSPTSLRQSRRAARAFPSLIIDLPASSVVSIAWTVPTGSGTPMSN